MAREISAIILAAGESTRMGKPKQLLTLNNIPILEHVIRYTLHENFFEVITIIGHVAEEIRREIPIDDLRFRWIINERYKVGQSSSLRTGISHLDERCSSFVVFLGDLPFVSEETVRTIYRLGKEKLQATSEPFVIQPAFENIIGHPVFFGNMDKKQFRRLEGDTGAKSYIKQMKNREVIKLNDFGITFDIDTPEQYEQAKELYKEMNK